ncbi:hypothetical protein GGS20DRAFT_306978 [Poronia punctata]|nr:hypothetical protein GGS20DRAFT_306978 [Poronia punctata]
MSTQSSTYDPNTFWNAPARNFRSSARLHLQHLLFQNTIPFLLDPRIEDAVSNTKNLKIADLACGNGIWLTSLHDELTKRNISSAQLDGYDINAINFPSKNFLPPSVSLHKLDVLAQPLPENLIGAYDIVHIRAFSSLVLHNDPSPIISAAKAMLKPGGWIQWDESGADFIVQSPSPDVGKTACLTIDGILKAGGEASGAKREFITELDRHANGFQEVQLQSYAVRKQDYKAWTEDYLMVWEDLAMYFPLAADKPDAPLTREAWNGLFVNAIKETEQGVALFYRDIVVMTGQKPT